MPEDTHEDVRRQLFEAAWDAPAFAPAPERTVVRARRRAAMTISGAIAGAAVVVTAVVLSAGGILGMNTDRSATDPREQDPREYLVNVTTGQRTEFHELPRGAWLFDVSPDGSLMAFTSDASGSSQIWISGRDGSGPRQLTHDPFEATDPSWSPDGTEIAYVGFGRGETRSLFVVDVESGDTRRLIRSERDPWNPRWSPDGERIVFHVAILGEPVTDRSVVPSTTWTYQLRVVELESRTVTTLAGSSEVSAYDGSWTPDGRIVFVRGTDVTLSEPRLVLSVIDPDGTHRQRLVEIDADGWGAWESSVSPNGSLITYSRTTDGEHRIIVFVIATGRSRSLAEGWFATWVDDDTLLVQDTPPPFD